MLTCYVIVEFVAVAVDAEESIHVYYPDGTMDCVTRGQFFGSALDWEEVEVEESRFDEFLSVNFTA